MNNSMVAHLWANEMKEFAMVITSILKVKEFTPMEVILRLEESCETSVEKRRI